jgi:hypothetical protein
MIVEGTLVADITRYYAPAVGTPLDIEAPAGQRVILLGSQVYDPTGSALILLQRKGQSDEVGRLMAAPGPSVGLLPVAVISGEILTLTILVAAAGLLLYWSIEPSAE